MADVKTIDLGDGKTATVTTLTGDDLDLEKKQRKLFKEDEDRSLSEVVTLWLWRALLMIGIVVIIIAMIFTAWKIGVADELFWTGVAVCAGGLTLALVRDWVFKHK